MPFALTVFSDLTSTHKRTILVNKLRNYFEVYIDAVNTAPILLKTKYGSSVHKFFGHDCGELIMFDVEVVDMVEPEFIVTFDTKKSKTEWKNLFLFFKNLLDEELDDRYFSIVKDLVDIQSKCDLKSSPDEPEKQQHNEEYLFNMEIDEGHDMGFFQIDKPFTDRPYTTIIRSLKERGLLPLFSSLYIDKTWGLGQDNQFLKELWVHLGMNATSGILDLENELKNHIQRCSPENGIPESEPEVYRMTIQELKVQMTNKNKRYTEVLENLRVKRNKMLE